MGEHNERNEKRGMMYKRCEQLTEHPKAHPLLVPSLQHVFQVMVTALPLPVHSIGAPPMAFQLLHLLLVLLQRYSSS
jgi:hypothetical protein